MSQMLDLSGVKFLVVDDVEYARKLTESILRVLGAKEIKTVEGAAEAFSLLKTFNADIIISDWMMEPLDGIEFTRMLRTAKDSPDPMVPIIMLTSYSENSRVAEARNAGVTEFMVKPISPKSLYLRIAQIIQKPRQFVRTETFYGPDRHRHDDDCFTGQRRRETDNEVPLGNGDSQTENELSANDQKKPQTIRIRKIENDVG